MMIFSTNQIKLLNNYNIKERQQIIALASQKLTVPQKLILNLIKLALLIPPFLFIANMQGTALILSITVVLIAYFTLLRPVMLQFLLKHIERSIDQYEKSKL